MVTKIPEKTDVSASSTIANPPSLRPSASVSSLASNSSGQSTKPDTIAGRHEKKSTSLPDLQAAAPATSTLKQLLTSRSPESSEMVKSLSDSVNSYVDMRQQQTQQQLQNLQSIQSQVASFSPGASS